MKKIVILSVFIALLTVIYGGNNVFADWWDRPTARPTQPSIERDGVPTAVPTQVVPTPAPTSVVQPTPTTGGGGTGGVPTQTPSSDGGSGSSADEDPCESGDSYTGPYCGWSPEKDKPSSSGGGGEAPRIGGPEVLGLSHTSGDELTVSDIMLLTGVLCLALYARSKMSLVVRQP